MKSHKIESVKTLVVDFESSLWGFEIAWKHIEIIWKWFKSYEVYSQWNHPKQCAVDDIINSSNHWNHLRNRLKSGTRWNQLYTQTASERPLARDNELIYILKTVWLTILNFVSLLFSRYNDYWIFFKIKATLFVKNLLKIFLLEIFYLISQKKKKKWLILFKNMYLFKLYDTLDIFKMSVHIN